MPQRNNLNLFRNALLFAILILIAIGGYFYFSKKNARFKPTANFADAQCESPLTDLQLQKAQLIMTSVIKDISDSTVCNSKYLRGCNPPQDISSNCLNIYGEVLAYLRHHKVRFCKSSNNMIFAEVDTEIPDIIFLSDRFFLGGDDPERRRTLGHELTHLAGFIKAHNNVKNCVYFEGFALQAEHCLTCEATLMASNKFSLCTSTSIGSFIISPK